MLSALKICLADDELLMHPAAHQVVRLSDSLRAQRPRSSGPDAEGDGRSVLASALAVAAPADAAGAPCPEGSGGLEPAAQAAVGGITAPPDGFMKLLQGGQRELLGMLASLPERHEVAAAAGKQLRQIVADARKHARRRLRQMDTQQQRQCGELPQRAAAERGEPLGLELMRQGVHLYLEDLAGVLDAWADHLGMENKLEPPRKRSKAMVL